MMSERLMRFGFHGFLNALPLLNSLQRSSSCSGFEMVVDVPCAVAEKLLSGQLDLAMIPSIEYLKVADRFDLLPGPCIASKGEVLTVLLISKQPLSKVRSVALDSRSRTSVALLQILFGNRFPPEAKYVSVEPEINKMLDTHDAALVIGDLALKYVNPGAVTVYDLSREWLALTGKAFVHAVVAVRSNLSMTDEMREAIHTATRNVSSEIAEIVKAQAENYEAGICEDYLRNKIRYTLGDEEVQGLSCFRDMCYDSGLLSQKHPIKFIQPW